MVEPTKRCPYCGEEILAVAIKCKHCGSDLTIVAPPAATQSKGFDIGWAILAIPIAGSLLLWFWVGNMNLLQGPGSATNLIIIAVVVLTAMLCAVEASKLGMKSNREAGTYSPASWVFIILLLWIVGYPAYLFKRRKYGVRNLLLPGLGLMAVFLGSAYYLESVVDERVAKITDSVNAVQHALDPLRHSGSDQTAPTAATSAVADAGEAVPPAQTESAVDAPIAAGGLGPDQSVNARITAYCHKLAGTAGGSYVLEQGCQQQEVDAWHELSSERQAQHIPDDIYHYCTTAPFDDSYALSVGCVQQEMKAKQSINQ